MTDLRDGLRNRGGFEGKTPDLKKGSNYYAIIFWIGVGTLKAGESEEY